MEENNTRYKKFLAKRFRIQKAMKDAGIKPGNQVVIEEEIIEWENEELPGRKTPVVITELITDKYLKEGQDFHTLASLSWDQKKEIMISMLTALGKIHSFKLLHGDLKPDNFMLTKKGSKFVAYLIDFDESYFEDDIPESVVQSPGYETPEAFCFHNEGLLDEAHGGISYITIKNDIYALGLIFHELLTGKLPVAILPGGRFSKNFAHAHSNKGTISLDASLKKQPLIPGKSLTYVELIQAMIAFNPKLRPSAEDLITMIQTGVPLTSAVPGVDKREEKTKPVPTTPFDSLFEDHHPWIEILPHDQLQSMGVTSLKRAPGTIRKVYLISKTTGDRTQTNNLSFWQLFTLGYAKKKKDPEIPDHEPFKNLSKEYLIRKNIVKIEHLNEDNYQVHYAERPLRPMKKEELLQSLEEGFSYKEFDKKTETGPSDGKPLPPPPPKPAPIEKVIQCEPFPEDRIVFADEKVFLEAGISAIRLNVHLKLYDLIRSNGSVLRLNAMKLMNMGFAKKHGS
jgi:serine/threonine protein kinase